MKLVSSEVDERLGRQWSAVLTTGVGACPTAVQMGGALLGPILLAVRSSMAAILQGQDSGILFAASITT